MSLCAFRSLLFLSRAFLMGKYAKEEEIIFDDGTTGSVKTLSPKDLIEVGFIISLYDAPLRKDDGIWI